MLSKYSVNWVSLQPKLSDSHFSPVVPTYIRRSHILWEKRQSMSLEVGKNEWLLIDMMLSYLIPKWEIHNFLLLGQLTAEEKLKGLSHLLGFSEKVLRTPSSIAMLAPCRAIFSQSWLSCVWQSRNGLWGGPVGPCVIQLPWSQSRK